MQPLFHSFLHVANRWRAVGKGLMLATMGSALLSACNEVSQPVAPSETSDPLAGVVAKHWETNAAVYWNAVARDLVIQNGANAFQAIRGYAIVSVAQYNAAVAAEREKLQDDHASVRAAIGAASVTALSYLFPSKASASKPC